MHASSNALCWLTVKTEMIVKHKASLSSDIIHNMSGNGYLSLPKEGKVYGYSTLLKD